MIFNRNLYSCLLFFLKNVGCLNLLDRIVNVVICLNFSFDSIVMG